MNLKSINSIDVVLASQAAWRSAILHQLGIAHRQVNHKYSEPKYHEGDLGCFIETIARKKAESLAEDYPESLIIAADQLVCIENTVLYKSGTKQNAIAQLKQLNGKRHQLLCAVAVLYKNRVESAIETAELSMRSLQPEEISTYVECDRPWDCAGSYKIEGLGASLFERIEVNDPTTIIGIPSCQLISILRNWGVSNLINPSVVSPDSVARDQKDN